MKQNTIPTLANGKQVYSRYTAQDRLVWQALLKKQQHNQRAYFSSTYVGCMHTMGMGTGSIPNFAYINTKLQTLTGWQLSGVTEIVDIMPFLEHMHKRCFPATTWIRPMAQLDYLEEPDMFHDVFGHVPLLAHRPYADFLHNLGVLGLKYASSESCLNMIQRMYWFTVEFGLIEEKGQLKAYGAGLISSPGEIQNYLNSKTEKRAFSVTEVLSTNFRTDIFQPLYFVIQNFEQLYKSLPEIEAALISEQKALVLQENE